MRFLRGVHWYLRELVGETQYDHYLVRHAESHCTPAPLSRREFEKQRVDRADARPGSRCC